MSFKKPGTMVQKAFGISYEADRSEPSQAPFSFNFSQQQDASYQQTQKQALSIFKYQKEILYLVKKHAVTILVGETGSGKSTQIPQYLLQYGWAQSGMQICVTQPRRLAVISLAQRVSEELNTQVGEEVGYQIQFEDVSQKGKTCIKYVTDGLLIRQMLNDPLLMQYRVIMIDEAHENNVATELLMGLLKKILRIRKDLRVIISSATIDAQKYYNFFNQKDQVSYVDKGLNHSLTQVDQDHEGVSDDFNKPAIMSVEGRQYKVNNYYLDKPCADYIKKAVDVAIQLHKCSVNGDILIFLTGQEDCDRTVYMLNESTDSNSTYNFKLKQKIMAVPLYSGLHFSAQQSAIQAPPHGYRKVICTTNIAETSITIGNVLCVIDSMFVKLQTYNPFTDLQSLATTAISKSQAQQRSGRAGRTRVGFCFRLCTEKEFNKLAEQTVPEMQRSDLSGAILQLKALGISNLVQFPFISPPPSELLIKSLENLQALGVIENTGELQDPMGRYIAELPIDPKLGVVLISSIQMMCAEEVTIIIAFLQIKSIWNKPYRSSMKQLDKYRSKFSVQEGDLISYLNVWFAWKEMNFSKKWCQKNMLNYRNLIRAKDIKGQLMQKVEHYVAAHGHPDNNKQVSSFKGQKADNISEKQSIFKNSEVNSFEKIAIILKCFLKGQFINIACLQSQQEASTLNDQQYSIYYYNLPRLVGTSLDVKLHVDPSSVLYSQQMLQMQQQSVEFQQPEWLMFTQSQESREGKFSMLDVSVIKKEWIMEEASQYYQAITSKQFAR